MNLDDLETIVEILAERARRHHRAEVTISGRDDTRIDLDRLVAAQACEAAILQNVEQLCLKRRRHLADFVEHHRAALRELENMMKRFVVLQDEGMILSELERGAKAHAQSASAPPEPPQVRVATPSADTQATIAPTSVAELAPEVRASAVATIDIPEASGGNGGGLFAIARAAAVKAEREAIVEALARFRWNRRKVAEDLGVSYKTLLTKMKECGISEPAESA